MSRKVVLPKVGEVRRNKWGMERVVDKLCLERETIWVYYKVINTAGFKCRMKGRMFVNTWKKCGKIVPKKITNGIYCLDYNGRHAYSA